MHKIEKPSAGPSEQQREFGLRPPSMQSRFAMLALPTRVSCRKRSS
jgi:hypothetical protein